MNARLLLIAGVMSLAFAWLGPLPVLLRGSFSAHMGLHMLVVGIGIPLLAAGLAPHLRFPPAPSRRYLLPLAASLLDLVVVWGWHAPALHEASRSSPLALAFEQASYAGAAMMIWLLAFGGPAGRTALGGALALFFTSMHMTLLGTLIGLAPRSIYAGHLHDAAWFGLDAVQDQQLGGVIMLAIGGVIYLSGALALVARLFRHAETTS